MPAWPSRRQQSPSATGLAAASPSRLDEIDEATPHRFRFWLASAADRGKALAALNRLTTLGELAVEPVTEPDGRIRFDAASTFDVRSAAILRPLYALDRAGIAVRGVELLDLVTDVDDLAIAGAVAAWERFGNTGPHRHRLEVLAGSRVIETCLTEMGGDSHAAWRFAAGCAAFNTPGSEARMLAAAQAARGWQEASGFVNDADTRASLAALTGEPFDPPVEVLAALIGRGSYVAERAAGLARSMKAPLPEPVVEALCVAAATAGDVGVMALLALENAAPSAAVRSAVEAALAGDESNLQATALGVLAHHWGAEARPTWRAFLASRSAPLREAAEETMGRHGDVDDLPEAAAQLAKLARTKSSVHMTPPRGADLVGLLVRHRDTPVARAGLDDLSARWDRLGDDLREWLAEHHPWLDPSHRQDQPVAMDSGPEERLEWPPPAIAREGDRFTLWFEGTDMFETRDRFEELAAAHPAITLIDGDREWASMRIASDDPEALINELWAAAGADEKPD